MASRLLKEGNPAITELSDPNRPLKLAEQFNSLYDDEWTDAYEVLTETKKMKEFEAIEILYKMLEVQYIANRYSNVLLATHLNLPIYHNLYIKNKSEI